MVKSSRTAVAGNIQKVLGKNIRAIVSAELTDSRFSDFNSDRINIKSEYIFWPKADL